MLWSEKKRGTFLEFLQLSWTFGRFALEIIKLIFFSEFFKNIFKKIWNSSLRKLPLNAFKSTYSPKVFSRPMANYSFSTNPNESKETITIPTGQTTKKSFLSSPFFQKYFGPQTYVASPKFKNRWLMVIPCFLSNLCIGSPYAWSMVAGTLPPPTHIFL